MARRFTGARLKLRQWFRKAYPRRMFLRFLLIIAVPMAITQAVSIFIFYDRHWSSVSKHMTYATVGDILHIWDAAKGADSLESAKDVVERASNRLYLRAYIADTPPHAAQKGAPSRRDMQAGRELLRELRASGEAEFDLAFANNYRLVAPLGGAALVIDVPYKRLANPSTYIFILWMAGTGLALAVGAVLFMRNQVRAVAKLADAMEHVGKGDFSLHFRPGGASEVRAAGESFLAMKRRIERFLRSRTDMLGGISHDLRTPITRMRLRLEMAPEGENKGMQSDLDDMERMIDGYLRYMRDEHFTESGEKSADLAIIVTDTVEKFRPTIADISVAIPPNLPQIYIEPPALSRIVTNLLQNAERYGNGRVTIAAERVDRTVVLSVEDNGPGVEEELQEEIFRPFFRVGRQGGGTGLGLAIVKDLTDRVGGDVVMTIGKAWGGAKCVVTLPIA